jgi:hypothetical protein
MSAFDQREQRMLRALREHDEPTGEDRRRVRAALLTKVALGAGAAIATLAAPTQSSAAASVSPLASSALAAGDGAVIGAAASGAVTAGAGGALFSGVAAKVVAAVIAAGTLCLGTVGAVWLSGSAEQSSAQAAGTQPLPAAVERPRAPVARPASEELPLVAAGDLPLEANAESAPSNAAPQAHQGATAGGSTAGSASAGGLEAELVLITRAEQALRAGSPAAALKELEQHRARHPRGTLGVEREGLRAVALCQAGQKSAGKRLAESFLARHSGTPIAARVAASCGLM